MLGEAVVLDPSSVPALVRLAEVETEIGRSAEAIATFRLAIAASSDPKGVSAAWARIGEIAERALADGPQAVDAYRNALLSTRTICPRWPGWRAGSSVSATGPTPRRRCADWPPSRVSATRASGTW